MSLQNNSLKIAAIKIALRKQTKPKMQNILKKYSKMKNLNFTFCIVFPSATMLK